MNKIPTLVLGGSGYVAGELLRLLAGHPALELAGVMSESRAGDELQAIFPQLQRHFPGLRFDTKAALLDKLDGGRMALFSAAPHGASAALIAEFLLAAETSGTRLTVVDASADFRYTSADDYARVYDHPHGAPALLSSFASALPEHLDRTDKPHIGNPGCFATALLLACVPMISLGLSRGDLYATGITGSTGSGRSLSATTHHPERHANLFAYKALSHRHVPEVIGICGQLTGTRPALRFVPHSGPFARGIHMTVQARLDGSRSVDELRDALSGFYAGKHFVRVCDGMPRIKDVVGSNYAHIGVAADDDAIVLFVVIDNLVKGAAGGAVQWMNRQLGFGETDGLDAPALAWA